MRILHVASAENTKLRRIIASEDAHHGHDVAFNQTVNGGNTIDVEAVAILHDGRVATGVDGTDDGILNFQARGLQEVVPGKVFIDFSNGFYRQGQWVASGDDGEFIVVTTVDGTQLDEAVICSTFAVCAHLVADRQIGRHRISIKVKNDASGFVLHIHIAAVDEGDHTFHAGIFVGFKGMGFGDGDRLMDGVSGCGDSTVGIA